MVESEFPDYAINQTDSARDSRRKLSAEQNKILDEIIGKLQDDPDEYAPLSTPTDRGQLVYQHPTSAIEVLYKIDADEKVLYFYHFSAPLPPRQTIFISYSHADLKWLQMLRKFLVELEAGGMIKLWDDRLIKAGERWQENIKEALDCACAAVLLVSQDFLASEFITTYELPRLLADAKREGKKIFWIHVSPSNVDAHQEITNFQSPLDPKQTLEEMKPVQRKKALVQLSRKLRQAMMG